MSLRAIEDRTRELESEIKDRESAEKKLTIAMKEAHEANAAKSRFLATMSHELRTPLNAIIGYSEMLEEDAKADDSELTDDLNRISRSGRHLLTLINDILDLSKIEAGKLDLEIGHTDIFKIVQYVEDLTLLLFDRAESCFYLNVNPEIKSIYTDETRLRQIIFNLLSNAAKFTEKGEVRLDIRKVILAHGIFVELKVSDTGIGMSRELVSAIFKPFVQGDSSTSRKYGGTGLGLSITYSLVKLLEGEMEVISSEGKGSIFTVRLPFHDWDSI